MQQHRPEHEPPGGVTESDTQQKKEGQTMKSEISKYELWKIRRYKHSAGISYIADEIGKEQHAKMPRPFVLTNCQQERPCAVCGKEVMMIRRQKYCPACSMKSKKERATKAAAKGSI